MEADRASRTAVLVCQGRAVAHGRLAEGRFVDPVASLMLRDQERVPVERVRAGTSPSGWGERTEFELLRATSEVMVPRTVAIDDAVRSRPTPQLVILGAGLDDRVWRLPELDGVDVFEVDHPATQRDKRSRIGNLPIYGRSLRFVAVDFTTGSLETALSSAGHRPLVPTTWIWEGVVPYLSRGDVATTVRAVTDRSAAGSRLIVAYQSPSLRAAVGHVAVTAVTVAGRRRAPWADEPRRSSWTPKAMSRLLTGSGWAVARDDDLLTLAQDLGLAVGQRTSLRTGRVTVADR